MVRRRHLLYLLYTSSARPPSSTPFFTALPPPPPSLFNKGYCSDESGKGKHADDEPAIAYERARTTLEEFKRLEEEKAHQGIVSQTVDKAEDGFMEAAAGDGNLESVKERYKEAGNVHDPRRTGNE